VALITSAIARTCSTHAGQHGEVPMVIDSNPGPEPPLSVDSLDPPTEALLACTPNLGALSAHGGFLLVSETRFLFPPPLSPIHLLNPNRQGPGLNGSHLSYEIDLLPLSIFLVSGEITPTVHHMIQMRSSIRMTCLTMDPHLPQITLLWPPHHLLRGRSQT
jgi:hypothetical protein